MKAPATYILRTFIIYSCNNNKVISVTHNGKVVIYVEINIFVYIYMNERVQSKHNIVYYRNLLEIIIICNNVRIKFPSADKTAIITWITLFSRSLLT